VFLFTERPLPETSQVHLLLTLPDRAQPLSLIGKVSHTIVADDDEPPGMGIVFDLDDAARDQLVEIVRDLEAQLHAGTLPTGSVD
jgi:Tfp pilus assembly protein PilZ